MSLPGRQVNIRMPEPLARRLDELQADLPGLPQSIILKAILRSVLERPREERAEAIAAMLRRRPLA